MFVSETNKLASVAPINRKSQTAVFVLPVAGAANPTLLNLPPGLYQVRCPDGVPGKSVQLAFGQAALPASTSLPSSGTGFKDVVSVPSNVWFTVEIGDEKPVADWNGAAASTLIVTKVVTS